MPVLSGGMEGLSVAPDAIPAVSVQKAYALSYAQRRLWILGQIEGQPLVNNLSYKVNIKGELDIEALEKSLQLLFQRHESLRTNVAEGRQFIHPERHFKLKVRNVIDANEEKLRAYLQSLADYVFDLERDALLRVRLLITGPAEHLLVFTAHHIVFDEDSFHILAKDLFALYTACVQGAEQPLSTLPPLPAQYKDYAAWQNELLDSASMQAARAYWLEQLAPAEGRFPLLELPTGQPRPAAKTYHGATVEAAFGPALSKRLDQLARHQGADLFTALAALVHVLLYRYTGQEDIIIGTQVSGRNHLELQSQAGLYVNTLALRQRIVGEDSFLSFLQKAGTTVQSALEHASYPFARLLSELDLPQDKSRSPVFDVMVRLNRQEDALQPLDGLSVTAEPMETAVSPFDLAFDFVQKPEGLSLKLTYNTDLFAAERIQCLLGHFETLAQSALADPEAPVARLDILPQAEKNRLLHQFNHTTADFSLDQTIVQRFEALAEKAPGALALVFDPDTKLTYRELNEKSNRLGRYLRTAYDIQADDIIALQLERSEWMIIAILGVMKAGAAYLPIAPDNPAERTEYMLKDSRAKALLVDAATHSTGKKMEAVLPVFQVETAPETNTADLPTITDSRSLAYVIYTSGSTGQPKGVMIEQRGAVNMALSHIQKCGLRPDGRASQFVSYNFDASIGEIFMTLLSGAALIMADKATLNTPERFLSFLERHQVTVLSIPPAYLAQLKKPELKHVRVIISGGESPHLDDVLHYRRRIRYFNIYGPTECSVCITMYEVPGHFEEPPAFIPVGGPIPNTSLYILDKNQALLPFGIAGELYVGGANLARGYLNNPELTAEKFIPSPFKAGERLYRTGDLAQWTPEGDIAFLGRIDHQMKIRGYRVEAGEIEHALLAHATVKTCVVAAHEGRAGKQLAAYLVPKPGCSLPGIEELRAFLSNTLPEYMIPAYFVEMEALPTNIIGKIDRKALPAPTADNLAQKTGYAPPRDATEQTLAAICEEVLEMKPVGIYDDFFQLGGNSLNAVQLAELISEHFGVDYPLYLIFEYPAIAETARKIDTLRHQEQQQIAQPGIWFNPDANPLIFVLPPLFGLGVKYRELSHALPDVSLFCFDLIPADNWKEVYYDLIKKLQPEGPYVLMGYSIGGTLAFEVARYLESRGEAVSNLIFGHSIYPTEGEIPLQPTREFVAHNVLLLQDGLKEQNPLYQNSTIIKQAEKRVAAYKNLIANMDWTQKTRANIHQIVVRTVAEPNISLDWKPHTEGDFILHPAPGTHARLFQPPYVSAVAGIIRDILRTEEWHPGMLEELPVNWVIPRVN
ncbi:MAG: amino acid adenylation domain-containing protein [Lewinellaceae bacterium]|nr:amino acid adenylation domain-containing protein [Lewinellaceae bacterium]